MNQQPQQTPSGDAVRDNGIYLLMEDINIKSCRDAIQWILEENLKDKKKPFLQMMINSPGGDVSACFALVDAMKGSKIPVRTIGLGMIASCGLLLFIAGEKGHRTLTPNTSILSHQWSWGSSGKVHELFATVREFELTSKRLLEHYKKCTGLSEKTIRQILLPPQDVWLDSKEALKYKLCDRVKSV